ncbi:MAG: ABC-F type ribosomal protection protein [Lachnospiraceae bacterium]|nr:ABC-F type ribosomal protection protein [Lachnospiraceae bacterium]
MLYQITNGTVAFGDKVVLDAINFEVRNTEKIAVIGRNGCGKSTLLNLILGEIPLTRSDGDGASIAKTGGVTIGCLKQMTFDDEHVTLAEEIKKVFQPILAMKARMETLLAAIEKDAKDSDVAEYSALEERFTYLGGYRYEKDYELIVKRFGFTPEDEKKQLTEFSGGQRTKIAFVKLLLSKPDILLLDEPTNHLDISTIGWLEGYLKEYPRAVILVSHDRMFLDRVADVVYEIERGHMKRYPGNYTNFMARKREDYDKQLKAYEAQQKEIARLMELVERFKNTPTKVAMTRSKLKAIEHMEKIEKPESFDDRAFFSSLVPEKESGNDVLQVQNLVVGYDKPLAKVNFEQKKGQKIAIIGGNGLGKSTFLKTLVSVIKKHSGTFSFGYNVEIGYFDQQMARYESDKSVIDEFWDEYPTMTETQVRNILGGFLFRGDDVFKNVNNLSGGEKVRLALAKIFEARPNFLLLDEPTNHMDIVGKEALESLLKNYEGTVLFVSHDRYFVREIADALLVFTEEGAMYYPFDYTEYERNYGSGEKAKTGDDALRLHAPSADEAEEKKGKPDAAKNYNNPGKERAKRERRIAKLEELIEAGEERLAALNDELVANATDYGKLAEIQKEIDQINAQNDAYMEEWEKLSEEE